MKTTILRLLVLIGLLGSPVFTSTALTLAQQATEDKGWQQTPKPAASARPVSEAVRQARDQHFAPYSSPTPLDDPEERSSSTNSAIIGGTLSEPRIIKGLPVCQVANIFVATITDFQPFLSNSRTALYTEMYFRVDQIIKSPSTDSTDNKLSVGSEITTLLPGGSFALPNGRIITPRQPQKRSRLQSGQTYVFFGDYVPSTESYSPLKLWEVERGLMKPVSEDDTLSEQQGRSHHAGSTLAEFLDIIESQRNLCDK
ncbi:MAG TPA: hypothetical protein VN622_11840 [Clostridia bacterium]|nr:hypothetical protein [Clostridia bacterium]